MIGARKKLVAKKGTGTVPKTKYRNNTTCPNQRSSQQNLSNNLDLDWQRHDYLNQSRNLSRNLYQLNPYMMDGSFTEDHRQNGVVQIHMPETANGTLSTPSTSGSDSRRDSVGTIPKCDNVKKCPDKKQIENKLTQIREYLRVTSNLMSSIKNEDQNALKEKADFEKMIVDLKDSEAKLMALLNTSIYDETDVDEQHAEEGNHNMGVRVCEHMQKFSKLLDILSCQKEKFNNICNTNKESLDNGIDNSVDAAMSVYQRNELEEKVEITNRKVQLLREQQNALIDLKRKAENQLRDARQAQENLLYIQQQQEIQQKSGNQVQNCKIEPVLVFNESQLNSKPLPENHFDAAIKELEDRLISLRTNPRQSSISSQESSNKADGEFGSQQEENRIQLMQILENRDSQLHTEHVELQQKLSELQQKKMQIDQLAQQLQNLGEEDDDDIGHQVRKIVTMKQQLSSLKDLLEVVKNTEFSLLDAQNVNELEAAAMDNILEVRNKTDNIQQDVRLNTNHNETNVRLENNSARGNEQWITGKQRNNDNVGNIQEREKVLAELKAKKRELEEIIYKQKDRTSINNDVCSETSINKSDMGSNNMFDNVVMSWLPVHPNQRNPVTSAYSSDDCLEEDINEYSDLNSSADVTIGTLSHPQSAINSNYSTSHFPKRGVDSEQGLRGRRNRVFEHLHSSPRVSEQCLPLLMPSEQEGIFSNSNNDSEASKVQQQLELIQSVCQSLLDQQSSNNIQQVRNNLSPSPMYTEPRAYVSTNPRQNGAINSGNQSLDGPFLNTQLLNSHCTTFNDVANNQNMLAANTLQTQAFLLNTLNQCCQMLWFQQREITSLRNTVGTLQDQVISGTSEQEQGAVPLPSTSYVFPNRPISSLSNFRAPSQPRNMPNPKINHVSAACSLPNLNPSSHANLENAFVNHNNVRASSSARLLESSLNNATPIHSHHNLSDTQPVNNTVLSSINVNASMHQPLPSQIWNGQALNNQVAPGNRANNYWDNFRSYSRQNLLSTSSKSNDGLQNASGIGTIMEHSNVTCDRAPSLHVHPFSVPKLNMVHNESNGTLSEPSSTRRQLHFKTAQNLSNSSKPTVLIPPDVLNINHSVSQKSNESTESANEGICATNNSDYNMEIDINGVAVNISETNNDPALFNRNPNEWHGNEQSDNLPKSKLFEELRDNVYREVANLISANENRPHFLIQLFRDLQHINSDSLRGRTLQSIQTVLTHSINSLDNNVRGANRQTITQPLPSEQEVIQIDSEYFSLQPSLWPQSPILSSRESSNMELENIEDPDIHNILRAVFSLLKAHKDDILQPELISLLKEVVAKALPFSQMLSNTNTHQRTFQKHFVEALEKFQGKRIADIKKELLKTISDVLVGEFSFIYFIQDNIPDNCENLSLSNNNNIPLTVNGLSLNLQSPNTNHVNDDTNTPQMQNGDLAEADQSQIDIQEDEGAVGGVLNLAVEPISNNTDLTDAEVGGVPKIDFPVNTETEAEFVEQGLDQVPTRLTTRPKSHSNTPKRDRSSSSRSDSVEHF